MKKIKKLLCLLLAVVVVFSIPLTAFAQVITNSPFKKDVMYAHQSKFDGMNIVNGLDLSHHNDTADFKKLKKAGVQFVFLRIGFRGYGYAGNILNDTKFNTFYDNAKKEGISVGAYFYSQALNKKEAIEEADRVLKNLNGRALDLPVVFDYEFANVYDGRLDAAWRKRTVNREILTQNTIAFCERIKENGYEPMVYASEYFFYDNLNTPVLENNGYAIWLAHYTNKTDYKGKFNVWQYSETGAVDGVSGKVDCNFMYLEPLDLEKPHAKVIETNIRSARIEWNEINGVDGYEIVQMKGDSFIPLGVVEGATAAKLTGLQPATNYYLYVRAYRYKNGIKHFGEVGNRVRATTKPAKTTGLKVASRTDKSISLTWEKLGNPTGYNVYMYNAETKKYELALTTQTNSATIEGLKPYTCYYFKVEAVKGKYIGEKSDRSAIYTRPKTPVVTAVTSPSKKRIKISWKKNTENAGYQIQWSTTKNFSSNVKSETFASKTASSKTVTTYRTNEYYSIRVRSYVIKNGAKFYSPWTKGYRIKVK